MSKSRLISGKVKKVYGSDLDDDRNIFLGLSNAEPDLGIPAIDGSILVADADGARYWSPSIKVDLTGNLFLGTINSADGSSAIRITGPTVIEDNLTVDGIGIISDISTQTINSIDSSSITIVNSIIAQSDLEVQNDLVVNGNFTVLGSTTTINSSTLTVEDKNIELAKNSTSAETSDGAGITVIGPTTPATITYDAITDTWNFNKTIVGTVQGATSIQDIDDRISLFFDNDINTSDSSSIVFVPSVEIQSNLLVENDLTVTNTVYATRFIGDGSGLTGVTDVRSINDLEDVDTASVAPQNGQGLIWDSAGAVWKPGPSGVSLTTSELPPTLPRDNDLWFDSSNLNLYINYNDSDSVQWVQINTAGSSGTGALSGGGSGGSGVVVYATPNDLPLSNNTAGDQAYVTSTNRLYLWTGNGWFNIALINTNPTITQGPNSTYKLQTDGSPTVIELIASDPEGLPITWSFQVTGGTLGNIATISQNNNVFTITPTNNPEDTGTFTVTFTASDGVNIATAISSFSLVFSAADQYYNQSVVLTTSAVNNGNNNTFIDSSTNNFTLTRNGNVTQGTFSPYSLSGWSNYFYQDRITTPSDTSLSMQSGDFTFECWYYPTGKIAAYPRIFQFGSAEWGTSDNLAILDRHDDASTKFSVAIYNLGGNSILLQSSTVVQDNVWYHISLTREGSTFRLFINGVLESTYTNSGAISTSSSIIGQIGGQGAANAYNAGYISDLRIIKGTALYTSNFTPSVDPLTAVPNTVLLTCQSNRFKDSSSNNFTLTMFGDVKISKFSPYIPNNPYDSSVYGGSGYFVSATGNYLSAGTSTTLALGDGDFCIECWIYITAYNSNTSVIFDYRTSGGSPSNIPVLTLGTNGQPNFYFQVASPVMNGSKVVPLNAWTHLAIVRNGNATNNCTMYMNGESIATATNTSNLGIETLAINGAQTIANYNQVGWFADFRIVKGSPVYTGTFTPPTEPLTAITNTSLLLNFTNANIYDETGKVTLETVGDAKVSTSVVKYGDGSIAFDGTGDYLLIPNCTEIDFGTGNFTIEMWLNLADVTSTWQAIISRAYTITGGWRLYKTSGLNQLTWYVGTSAAVTTTNGHLTNNTWSHVAVVRNNGVISIYIDGVSRGSASNTTNFNPGNYALEIGSGVVTSAYPMTGYISDLRITKGIARYTTNFTPPTQKLGYNNDE